jgi:hypothetical protein
VIWRLHREGQRAHAEIAPRKLQTTFIWWIDNRIEDADNFVEWTGALDRAGIVRARLLRDGWTDVT